MRCPGQGAPSARERTSGQGFPSPYQPDKGRSAIYRTDLGSGSCWYALCATIVGNRGKPSEESRLKGFCYWDFQVDFFSDAYYSLLFRSWPT